MKRGGGWNIDQAREVFSDGNAIVDRGKKVEGEERWITIGKTLKLFIIAVVFTIKDATIRIISARQARKNEIKEYIGNALKGVSDEEDDDNR